MNLTKIRNSVIAGFCGTAVHSLLMLVHSDTGPLPEFQPNDDFHRALSWLTGTNIHPSVRQSRACLQTCRPKKPATISTTTTTPMM